MCDYVFIFNDKLIGKKEIIIIKKREGIPTRIEGEKKEKKIILITWFLKYRYIVW
jgi:hypothetical protein